MEEMMEETTPSKEDVAGFQKQEEQGQTGGERGGEEKISNEEALEDARETLISNLTQELSLSREKATQVADEILRRVREEVRSKVNSTGTINFQKDFKELLRKELENLGGGAVKKYYYEVLNEWSEKGLLGVELKKDKIEISWSKFIGIKEADKYTQNLYKNKWTGEEAYKKFKEQEAKIREQYGDKAANAFRERVFKELLRNKKLERYAAYFYEHDRNFREYARKSIEKAVAQFKMGLNEYKKAIQKINEGERNKEDAGLVLRDLENLAEWMEVAARVEEWEKKKAGVESEDDLESKAREELMRNIREIREIGKEYVKEYRKLNIDARDFVNNMSEADRIAKKLENQLFLDNPFKG